MNKTSKIFVAGHRGLVGSAIIRYLQREGFANVITKSHSEFDLINQKAVEIFFAQEKPEYVFLAAAKVGGIMANATYPAEFIYQNMMIGFNVVHAAYKTGVKKLLNLGSTCIYPKMAPQPIKEEYLLTGSLEPSNDAYALAKIGVIKLCAAYNKQYGTNYLSVMPTNLYGIGDNYDLETSHVLPAMIRKFHEAKVSGKNEVVLWGDGSPLREFTLSCDLAHIAVELMKNNDAADMRHEAGDFITVGSGTDLTIKALANTVRAIVYGNEDCNIVWDATRPNGTPRKLCDIARMTSLGYKTTTPLEDGIKIAYKDFLSRYS